MPFFSHSSIRSRVYALSPPAPRLLLLAIMVVVSGASVGLVQAQEPGFIEITLRTCPPGYDVTASGADPETDCALAGDGIRFTLREEDPGTDNRHAETGEREEGVALFRDVASGQYVLSQNVPDGVTEVVIVVCQGFNTGPFYRMPLHEGAELNIPVPNNAPIRCEWINILDPGATPLASPDASPVATPAETS